MSRYIDAEELRHRLALVWSIDVAQKIVDGMPAADVIEVCRCEHCFKSDPYLNGRWCKVRQRMMQNSDYCSYGERRDG